VAGDRRALIVAVDDYIHETLRRLRAPSADARALARVLGDPAIGGFDVEVVLNESSHDIELRVEDLFAEGRPDDLLLVHFSCHGLKSESGELFFAATDTRPDRLGSTAVAAAFLQRCMTACRARNVVLLLDCCYGGAFGRGVAVRSAGSAHVLDSFPTGQGGGRARAVITASNAMEYAFEGTELTDDHQRPPSLFTAAVVRGLETGEADRDEDGWVSLNELYEYVYDTVRAQNPNQTPSRDIEMQGELYVARSGRERVVPVPVPDEVRDALNDTNMFTRLGAVAELRSRLLGTDIPVALGAREALTDLLRTGVSYLADAAREALEAATLVVDETELSFGHVELGTVTPTQAVHLSGPPLARACSFAVSEVWLEVEPAEHGANVGLHATEPGSLHGHVTVSGPTGEVVLPVTATVTAVTDPHTAKARVEAQRTPPLAGSSMRDADDAAPGRTGHEAGDGSGRARDSESARRVGPGRRLGVSRTVGLVAIAAGATAVVGAFLQFQWDTPLLGADEKFVAWSILTVGLVAVAGGTSLLLVQRLPTLGQGITLTTGVAASWNLAWLLVFFFGDVYGQSGTLEGLEIGYLVELLAQAGIVAAAILVVAGLARLPQVTLRPMRGNDWPGWGLLFVGAVGALFLVLFAVKAADYAGTKALLSVWAAALYLGVSGLAVTLRPISLALAVHATWILCSLALWATFEAFLTSHSDNAPALDLYLISLIVLALLLLWRLWAARSRARNAAGR
jgi:Caspase domain